MAVKGKKSVWGLVDRFEGDKVILMIALLLILISIISVFSSTPLLAIQQGSSRMDIVRDQVIVAAAGLGVIALCYLIKNIRFYQLLSAAGYLVSVALLVVLVSRIPNPILRSAEVNDARRVLMFLGRFQVHVYEIVKIAMVMYLAWAVNTYRKGRFFLTAWVASRAKWLRWADTPFSRKAFYIYLPILVITGLVLPGSNSSALFIAFIMVMTVFVGGIGYRDIGRFTAGIVIIGFLGFSLYRSGVLNIEGTRLGTAVSRLANDDGDTMEALLEARPNSPAYNAAVDKLKQPVGALIAIQEGGLFGKGPGRSTQRYVVPVMFGDYMFSFIIEEYGLLGGLLVIILYVSLLARGAIIARKSTNPFAKTAVAGLILLITAQAFMHMMVNVHILPQTGQTLPLISHGNSSFLAFSLAFGIVISISRMVQKKVEREARKLGGITDGGTDEVRSSMDDLDMLAQMEENM